MSVRAFGSSNTRAAASVNRPGGEEIQFDIVARRADRAHGRKLGRLRVHGDASDPDGLVVVTASWDPVPRPESRAPGFPLPEIPDLYQGLDRDGRIGWAFPWIPRALG